MFDGIRDKIQNLQENLSTTLKELSMVDKQPSRKRENKTTPSVNYNAGAAVLEKFQSHWSDLHKNSQENATEAERIDNIIFDLQKSAHKQWKGVNNLMRLLMSLPDIVKSVNDLHSKTASLALLFEEVKNGLILLEEVLDVRDFENDVIEQKAQLSLYKETKLAQLESVKLYLEEKHKEKLKSVNENEKKIFLKMNEEIKCNAKRNKHSGALEDIIIENDNPENLENLLNHNAGMPEPKNQD